MSFQLGREGTVEADGKVWHLARLEYGIVLQFRDWVAAREGDPFAEVKQLLPSLDPATAKEWIAEAKAVKEQLQAFSIGCPLARKYLATELGAAELFYLLLLPQQPAVTREQALRLVMELGAQETAAALAQAQGSPPGKNAPAPAA